MKQIDRIASTFLLAAAILWPNLAVAAGALAIGLPSDVAKDGFAYGYTINYSDSDKARARALETCRTTDAAGDSARSLCSVVSAFERQCVAIAMDPQAGTPGVGWAIAPDKPTAERQALEACASTAGESRRGACIIDKSACDSSSTY